MGLGLARLVLFLLRRLALRNLRRLGDGDECLRWPQHDAARLYSYSDGLGFGFGFGLGLGLGLGLGPVLVQ